MKKKAHGVQLLLKMVVTDPDGKVISDTGRKPAKSFVLQFLKFLYGLTSQTGSYSAKDTSGNSTTIYNYDRWPTDMFNVKSAVAQYLYGVVIGTGDTAETNADYQLDTQLVEGTAAGQITHGECTLGAVAVVGANVDVQVTRSFTNGTGDTITVKEAGIYTAMMVGGPNYHCIVRDVLPAGINVPDKCSLSVIYTLRTTV